MVLFCDSEWIFLQDAWKGEMFFSNFPTYSLHKIRVLAAKARYFLEAIIGSCSGRKHASVLRYDYLVQAYLGKKVHNGDDDGHDAKKKFFCSRRHVLPSVKLEQIFDESLCRRAAQCCNRTAIENIDDCISKTGGVYTTVYSFTRPFLRVLSLSAFFANIWI